MSLAVSSASLPGSPLAVAHAPAVSASVLCFPFLMPRRLFSQIHIGLLPSPLSKCWPKCHLFSEAFSWPPYLNCILPTSPPPPQHTLSLSPAFPLSMVLITLLYVISFILIVILCSLLYPKCPDQRLVLNKWFLIRWKQKRFLPAWG